MHVVSQVPLGACGLAWSPSGQALQAGLLKNGALQQSGTALVWRPPRQITNFTSDRISSFGLVATGNSCC
jgi:hypothetical protein